VLVDQRPAGKSFPHKWEFPGGKIEEGESAAQSLVRELQEELGIVAHSQRPLISFRHEYPGGAVLLHVKEVLSYSGNPHGREGQHLRWVETAELRDLDLLDANTVIVRAIRLPRFCVITDARRFGIEETLQLLQQHLQQSRKLVIVREKTMGVDALRSFIDRVRQLCGPHESPVCVHSDCGIADFDDVDGVHLPARELTRGGRPDGRCLVGVSCHSERELAQAGEMHADYALLSPVRWTASHPDVEPLGWHRFSELCCEAVTPVYALGGMQLSDCSKAIHNGAQGVAVLSAAWCPAG
jgi:8-oxo-dGTP diphosphatase